MSGAIAPDLVDAYALLKLPRDASDAAIKTAYRERARDVHPDKNPSPQAAALFHAVKAASEVLLDKASRAQLDRKLDAAAAERSGITFCKSRSMFRVQGISQDGTRHNQYYRTIDLAVPFPLHPDQHHTHPHHLCLSICGATHDHAACCCCSRMAGNCLPCPCRWTRWCP